MSYVKYINHINNHLKRKKHRFSFDYHKKAYI